MSRVIMHIDMNSYFASVEQQADPSLRGKPVGVGGPNEGRSVISAASIEAKRRGVKSGMSIYEARKLCPDIILVPGNYPRYAKTTSQILNILVRFTPAMEVFSIDEAFLDVTPTLGTFDKAEKAACLIKKMIKDEVGEWLTCSIGIAPNKLMAKLGSDMKKPDGLVIIHEENIPAILSKTALDDLCGIGRRIKKALLGMGIDTVAKLGCAPAEVLIKRFGKYGIFLHNIGNGIDDTPVSSYYEVKSPKSMGHMHTLPEDTSDKDMIFSILLRLCEQVARRMRVEHYLGRVVSVTLRKPDFSVFHKQKALSSWIDDGYDIYKVAKSIIESFKYHGPVRLIGVSVSGLTQNYYQLSVFPDEQKKASLVSALDRINNRYGEFTVSRAALMLAQIEKNSSGLGAGNALAREHKQNEEC